MRKPSIYFVDDEYLVTALVPSETACFASSPGRINRTLELSQKNDAMMQMWQTYEVWISRDEMVDFLLYAASLEASVATRSKMSEYHVRILKMEMRFGLTNH